MSMGTAAPAGTVDNVVARIERMPTSWWHVKTRIIVGVATFFDAFDAIVTALFAVETKGRVLEEVSP